MTKIVVQVFDTISLRHKYICKLARPECDDSIWTYADAAELAWRFDSLQEAEQCWKSKFTNVNNPVYFIEVNG